MNEAPNSEVRTIELPTPDWFEDIRREYADDRYLRNCDREELDARLHALASNLTHLDEDGWTFEPDLQARWGILKLFTEARHELSLRVGGPVPDDFLAQAVADDPLFSAPGEKIERAVELVQSAGTLPEECLFKLGEERWLRRAMEEGEILVSPATHHSDESLPDAIRDDELEATVELDPRRGKLQVLDEPGGEVLSEIDPESVLRMRHTRSTGGRDYFVYCLTRTLLPRLFFDFSRYDSCLLIHKPGEFLRALSQAMEQEVGKPPRWAGHVRYYDPWKSYPKEIQPVTYKHFRYAYQKEFRVVWFPAEPVAKLTPVKVYLDNLSDYAELLVL